MLNGAGKCVLRKKCGSLTATLRRSMTTTEVSTALRPFYFSVHPDLFGQHPNQRLTNENSLKQLSSVMETLQSRRPAKPCNLPFYLREKNVAPDASGFRLIRIDLRGRNVRDAVLTILKTCDLSTEYVDKIPVTAEETAPPQPKRRPFDAKRGDFGGDFDPIFGPLMRQQMRKAQEAYTLGKWLENNYRSALDITESHRPLREELARLRKSVAEELGLLEVQWDCGWNETHFRGCLKSFQSLAEQHPKWMGVLRGRTLVFGPFTGVSLEGHIMLNSGEVRHNWLDLIKNVRTHDACLLRIPAFEKAVSQVLRNIKVGRRKFMPKVMAGEYERHLQKITTSLSDYLGRGGYPKRWPPSLEAHEIVVETEAGPLMVSPTGQFIAPAGCPGSLLVNFIDGHMDEAAEKRDVYQRNKHVERSLHRQSVEVLRLSALRKDDSVTPDLMIKCLERLLKNRHHLHRLEGVNLNITNYYSVLSDGVVCVPWNWNL